jgi:hypothetical protein
MNFRLLIAAAALAATSFAAMSFAATAQGRDGSDTPGAWKVTHFQPFGLWDSMCDDRATGDELEERCYVRYVDVYSPKPQFGAAFAFIVPDARDGAVNFDFGFERGTRFTKDGFRIDDAGSPAWVLDAPPCDGGGSCAFEGAKAVELEKVLDAAATPAFVFQFVDRYGRDMTLTWQSEGLTDAIDDMRAQARNRSIVD